MVNTKLSQVRPVLFVPSLLSGLRLATAMFFPVIEPRWWFAAIVFAGVSDFVDGVIARRFNAATWIGGLLDAIADKAVIVSVLVTFVMNGVLSWRMVPLMLARDVTVGFIAVYAVCIREWAAFRMMPSRLLGKLTTVAIIAAFLTALMTRDAWSPVEQVVYFFTVLLSFAAAADYFGQFLIAHRAWRAGHI
jgi:cardiolipin synthase